MLRDAILFCWGMLIYPSNLRYMKILLIGFIFLFINPILYSQTNEISFEHYSTDQGLSSPVVNCIIKDKMGYIWIGKNSGLDRFDGINFKSYKHITGDRLSLPGGLVLCLLEDYYSKK